MSRITRLNVKYCGKRTTARFPYELWELYEIAAGSRSQAISELESHLENETDDMGGRFTASDAARAFMKGYTAAEIRAMKRVINKEIA